MKKLEKIEQIKQKADKVNIIAAIICFDCEQVFEECNQQDKCVGCGDCVDVCAFDAREIVEGKSTLILDYCIGCGRCVDACPNGALSIVIEDPKSIDEFVSKIESLVDVEKQQKKIAP